MGLASFYYTNGFDSDADYGKASYAVITAEIQDFAKYMFSQGTLIEIKIDPAKP